MENEPLTGGITVHFPSDDLLAEYKANEPFALIRPELLEQWEKMTKNAVFLNHGLPIYVSLTVHDDCHKGTAFMQMVNRAGKSVLLPLIRKYEAEAIKQRQEAEDYRRGITHAWFDEFATIAPAAEPKPKNKPWYGKFNKGKY